MPVPGSGEFKTERTYIARSCPPCQPFSILVIGRLAIQIEVRVGMTMEQTLGEAIDTHMRWVERFQLDLANGKLSERARDAGHDDLCEFGIWLYDLNASIKRTPEYRRVKNLHYDFHSVAGQIVKLLELEQFEEASNLITGEMVKISIELQSALCVWKDIEADKKSG